MNIDVQRLQITDIPFGKVLTDREDWGRSVSDWQRLVRLDPDGVFKAIVDGRDAGVIGVMRYRSVAWIHSLVVAEEFRGLGLGRILMDRALDLIRSSDIPTVKLDSVQGVEGFYESFGFEREFESMRCYGRETDSSGEVARIAHEDIGPVSIFDFQMTGIDRGRALREIHYDNPDMSFKVEENGRLAGYVMARDGGSVVHVGPCVCREGRDDIASRLIRSVMNRGAERYRFCIAGGNDAAVSLSKELGLDHFASATRMRKGVAQEESGSCYVMISAEKG